jgi:hypothetical protein
MRSHPFIGSPDLRDFRPMILEPMRGGCKRHIKLTKDLGKNFKKEYFLTASETFRGWIINANFVSEFPFSLFHNLTLDNSLCQE